MSSFGGNDVIADWAIRFGAELDELKTGLATMVNEVQTSTASVQSRARITGGAFATMGRVGSAAFGVIVKGATLAVGALVAMKAAVELEELSNRRLARSLDIAGESAAGAKDDFNDFASELDSFTSLSENKIRKLGAIGATIGKLTGEDLQQATVAAVGLAARYEHVGLNADQAMRLVARAANADFSGFERLGIEIDDQLTGWEKYSLVIQEGMRGMQDANDQATEGTGGLRRLLGAVTELAAAAGRLIGLDSQAGNFLDLAIDGIERLVQWLESLQDTVDQTFKKLLAFFGFDFGSMMGVDLILAQVRNIFDGMLTQLRIFWAEAPNITLEAINLMPDFLKQFFFGKFARGDLTAHGGVESSAAELERQLDKRTSQRMEDAIKAHERTLLAAGSGFASFMDRFQFTSRRGFRPGGGETRDTIQSVIGAFRIPGADEANRLRRQIVAHLRRLVFLADSEGRLTNRRRVA